MELEKNLVRLDMSCRPLWLQALVKETLAWAEDIADKLIFPRDDYREFLGWVIWHAGGRPERFFPLKMPGPDHNARWMSKCIYFPKILACSLIFEMTEEEKNQAEAVTQFVVYFYARPWFESSLLAVAARSNITSIDKILRYYR